MWLPHLSFSRGSDAVGEETLLCHSQAAALPETHQQTETVAFGLLLTLTRASSTQANREEMSPRLWLAQPHSSPPMCQHKGQEAAVAQQICLGSLWLAQERRASEVNWHSLKANPTPVPAPAALQTQTPVPKPNKPRSIKLRLLLLSFRSGPPACPPKAEGRAGLRGTALKHRHRQLEETPPLVPGGQCGVYCSFSRRVGRT